MERKLSILNYPKNLFNLKEVNTNGVITYEDENGSYSKELIDSLYQSMIRVLDKKLVIDCLTNLGFTFKDKTKYTEEEIWESNSCKITSSYSDDTVWTKIEIAIGENKRGKTLIVSTVKPYEVTLFSGKYRNIKDFETILTLTGIINNEN